MIVLLSIFHLAIAAQPLRECKIILFFFLSLLPKPVMNQFQLVHFHSSIVCQPWYNCGQRIFFRWLFCHTIPCSLLWHGWFNPPLVLQSTLLRSLVWGPSLVVLSSPDLKLDFMWATSSPCILESSGWWDSDGHQEPRREWRNWPGWANVWRSGGRFGRKLKTKTFSGFHFPRTQGSNRPLDKCWSHPPILLRIRPWEQYWRKEWLTGNPWHGKILLNNVDTCQNTALQSRSIPLYHDILHLPLLAIRLLWLHLWHPVPVLLHQQLQLQRGSSHHPEGGSLLRC